MSADGCETRRVHDHEAESHPHPAAGARTAGGTDDGHRAAHRPDDHDHAHDEPGHAHDEPAPDATRPHGGDDAHDHAHDGRPDAHPHDHGNHEHRHGGPIGWLREIVVPHSHDPAMAVDPELETSAKGMRALWISLLGLGLTAVLQAAVYLVTGSAALLSDTLHNIGDALTAVPLALAFRMSRRPPTRRYTYGFGRSEDLAGVAIVVVIAVSAAAAAFESLRRLLSGGAPTHLWAVALAGVVGFAGNEVVARYRIRVGREIGSAALVADGLHARTDGFTSLAVVAGAAGVALGWDAADPVVGLLITIAILVVLKDAARDVYRRLMDAVDPALVDRVDEVLRATPGVLAVGETRLRWIGHQLRAECEIQVDAGLSVADGHAVAVEAEHRLLHDVPRLTAALVHADPAGHDHHDLLSDHYRRRAT